MAFLPAAALLAAMMRCWVNVPYLDEWDYAGDLRGLENHSLSIWRIFAQHNEHRMAFARLVYLGAAYLFHGDARAQMLVTFGVVCLTSLAIHRLSRTSQAMSANAALLMLLFANCLLFSPVQFENWLWGFQACMALPLALVAACVAAAVSRLRVEFKFLLCIVFCACASLSLINGIASWVVVLPALLVHGAEQLKGRRYLIGVWVAAFVLFSAAYAWNYARPANHSNLTLNIENSMAAIAFFLVLLSAPLTVEFVHLGTAIPIAAGAVIFLWMLGALAYVVFHWRDNDLRRASIIWICVGGEGAATSLMMTFGRAGYGVAFASTSRYTLPNIVLIVSLFYLTVTISQDMLRRYPRVYSRILDARVVTGILTAILCLHLAVVQFMVPQWEGRRRGMLQVKTFVTFANVGPEDETINEFVTGFPKDPLRSKADSLNRRRMLEPPLFETDLCPESSGSASSGKVFGYLEAMIVRDDKLLLKGWAVLPDRDDPADGVLICWAQPGGPRHVLRVVLANRERPDIVLSLGSDRYKDCGWETVIPRSAIPPDAREITAYSYDALQAKAYPLIQLK